VHHQLESLFGALADAQVDWSLLRVPRDPELPPGDVDLLVRPEHLAAFNKAAEGCGFVGLPGWQEAPSLLYFWLDADAAQFLVLDVTDRIAFGRNGDIVTPFAEGVLCRAVHDKVTIVPAPDDAFWLLLLHCLLDKGAVPPHYRVRLMAAAADARLDTEIPKAVDARGGSPAGAATLRDAVMAADWDALATLAGALLRAWRWSAPPSVQLQTGVTRLRRVAGRPKLILRRRGVSVALLGPNGAGKSTLAEGIAATFPLPVSSVYMGLWKGDDDDPSTARQLVAAVGRPFRAWARLLRAKKDQAMGRLVVFDRYTYDARHPSPSADGTVKRTYMWLLSRSCPRPDLTLLLDLPGAVAFARKGENSEAEAEAERSEFLSLRDELPLHVLDATRDAVSVRAQALELIWRAYCNRWADGGSRSREVAGGAAQLR
jgi:thymidylate kinase